LVELCYSRGINFYEDFWTPISCERCVQYSLWFTRHFVWSKSLCMMSVCFSLLTLHYLYTHSFSCFYPKYGRKTGTVQITSTYIGTELHGTSFSEMIRLALLYAHNRHAFLNLYSFKMFTCMVNENIKQKTKKVKTSWKIR
jgi:hypothetical protein